MNKYLHSYYILGTVLGSRNKGVLKKDAIPDIMKSRVWSGETKQLFLNVLSTNDKGRQDAMVEQGGGAAVESRRVFQELS